MTDDLEALNDGDTAVQIAEMIGKTPVDIKVERDSDDYIKLTFNDGTYCKFYHSQDCCESVTIEDINGDFDDLIGYPILVAEERTGGGENFWGTYTFYTFRGIGGSVDVRWIGTSNGYYSERVDIKWGLVYDR